MAVAERTSKNRNVAVFVAVAFGLALAAVVATVGSTTSSSSEVQYDSLLSKATADKARHASYQGNVGTVYEHLQVIIDKILWHKAAWAKSYKGDLTRVAGEVAAAVKVERDASKASDLEAGKAAAAAAIATSKKNAWVAKAAALTAKKADAEEEKNALKALFDKGNAQKGGEIKMIEKIRCMVSKFNKDKKWKCDGTDPAPAPAAPAPTKKRSYELVGSSRSSSPQVCEDERRKADGTPTWNTIKSEAECKNNGAFGVGYTFKKSDAADGSQALGCTINSAKKELVYSPSATGKCTDSRNCVCWR